eukprot:scaffold177009_cov27-Prasinocladus_malaysianus.AAC.3
MLQQLTRPPKPRRKRRQPSPPRAEESSGADHPELTPEEMRHLYLETIQRATEAELAARGIDCPDVKIDLPAMRIDTDEPAYVNNDVKFKKPKAAQAKLEQVAQVLTALSTVVFRRGEPQMRLSLEGHTTAKAKLQELADSRAQVCKNQLVDRLSELVDTPSTPVTELLVGCRGVTASDRKSLTLVVEPFEVPPEGERVLTAEEEEQRRLEEARRAEKAEQSAKEEQQVRITGLRTTDKEDVIGTLKHTIRV